MCGRYALQQQGIEVTDHFHVRAPRYPDLLTELAPRYNILPTNQVPVVRLDTDGQRSMSSMMWWLIPFWADSPRPGKYPTFNARAETVDSLSSFREPFKKGRRCLIPATDLIEFKHVGEGKALRKFPFRFFRSDGKPVAFAGLWDRWRAKDPATVPEGQPAEVLSCTIVTFEPTELVQGIHGRMPVVLPEDTWDAWLNPATDWQEAKALLKVYPAFDTVREANSILNGGKVKGPECLGPPPEGESAADYEALRAAKATFAVTADEAPKKPQTRKPRAKKAEAAGDLFSTSEEAGS
jgi:putative SOS response-associated peptidase YedK